MSLKTEHEISQEGYEGYFKAQANPYLWGTWAFEAWYRGWCAAANEVKA